MNAKLSTTASLVPHVADDRVKTSRARLLSRMRLHQRCEGAAAVEFALILPLFIVLILGLIDFGHLFFVVNTMTNAAREGARRGVVQEKSTDVTTTATTTANDYLTAAGLGSSCPLDCPTASATLDTGTLTVTVTVSGTFQNITGFSYSLPGFSSPFASMNNLSAKSTMRWELQ